MATISINSYTQYYNSKTSTGTTRGSATRSTESAARSAAYSDAGAPSPGNPAPSSGGSSSTTKKFGMSLSIGSEVTPTYTSRQVDTGTEVEWYATCTRSKSSTGTAYQLKLNFNLPSGITSSNIASATITLNYSASWGSSSYGFALYAPKSTTNQTSYQQPDSTTILDKKNSFSVTGNGSGSQTLTITDAFKQCISKGQGWITLGRDASSVSSGPQVTLSSASITYTLTNTPCGAPTSVSFTSVVKPGGSLTVSWSGATAGTNNSISGYDVYYKIGSAPTTSSYDGSASVSSTSTSASTSFTISSSASRGSAFYAMVRTKGSAGSSYYSGWANGSGGKVNSLPGAPNVTVDKTRIRSDGTATTINFTVTAGSDNNTSQTKTLYYATSEDGTKTLFTSPLSQSLDAAATYYFWTYDGLEYSSSYTSKAITVNTPPSITSVTMSPYNNTTYTPSWESKPFVTNINCSETHTADSAATLTYSWRFATSSTVDGTYTNQSAFGTKTSYANLDVTANGVSSFGKFYKLKLRITDDLGEYAEEYAKSGGSDIIYCIPAAPTVSNVWNQNADGNANNTNPVHFDTGMRFIYSPNNNNGVSKELQYSTDSNFSTYNTISLSGYDKSDVTLSSLIRGTTYYFRIKMICNSISTIVTITNPGRLRANNITPTNISITPASGDTIKPYTQSTFSFSFQNQPTSWASAQDVASSYENIYSLKLKYSSRELNITSSGNNSGGTVSGTVTINSITTAQWQTLLGSADAPNTSYTITLEITVTNGFGSTFIATENFTVNFIEEIITIGTPELRIKTGSSTYTEIPYDGSSRYPIFETQTLQAALSGLQCYANQAGTVQFLLGTTVLGSTSIAATDWISPSDTDRAYTLSSEKTILYTVPNCASSATRNYSIKVTLANGKSITSDGGNLKSCLHMRFEPGSINFKVTGSDSSQQDWSCTDWGGDNSGIQYTDSYSYIGAQVICSSTSNGNYSSLGNATVLKDSDNSISYTAGTSGTIANSLSSLTYDIIYLGSTINLTLGFQSIDGAMPTGTRNYTYSYVNQFIYYRGTPNLLYGKNFFALNQSSPISGRNDQLLEISTASYTNNNNQVTRNKIYFTQTNNTTYFELDETNGNLLINCGTWDDTV